MNLPAHGIPPLFPAPSSITQRITVQCAPAVRRTNLSPAHGILALFPAPSSITAPAA